MALRYLSPIHKAGRQIGLYLESRCGALGVSNIEGHLLSYLRTYAPCPISEILRVFGTKPSTMTSILERLVLRGFIERDLDPDDRRSFRISLTRKGRSTADQINRVLQALEAAIEEHMSHRDLEGFQNVMSAIAKATNVEVRKERVP